MKFKKGDKVRFISDAQFDEWSKHFHYVSPSRELNLDKTYTVRRYDEENENPVLIEETGWWYWDSMFELVNEPETVSVISAIDAYGDGLTAIELQALNASFDEAIKEKAKATHYDNSFPVKRSKRTYEFDNWKYNKLR